MKKNIALIGLVLTNNLYAGRPLKSDDAFTLGRYLFQLELASEYLTVENSRYFSFPITSTFGLSDHTDFILNFSFNYLPNSKSSFGLGCTDFGVKQLLFNTEEISLSFKSGLSAEIVNNKLSSPSAFFGIVTSVELALVKLHFNVGYNQNEAEDEYKDLWFFSIAGEIPLNDQTSFALDLGIGRDPSIHCTKPESYLLVGAVYNLTENIAVDVGINFSVHHSTKLDLFTSGFTIIL
jgi:hypothetical protein